MTNNEEVLDILEALNIEPIDEGLPLVDLLIKAEACKEENELRLAIIYFALALGQSPDNLYIIQQIALLTYQLNEPDELAALKLSEALLLTHLPPDEQTDPVTLALAGGIYKNMANHENSEENIRRAFGYFEKAYILSDDYHNGINYAYLNLKLAAEAAGIFDTIAFYGTAQKVWRQVVKSCQHELLKIAGKPRQREREKILKAWTEALLGLSEGVVNAQIVERMAEMKELDESFTEEVFMIFMGEQLGLSREVREKIAQSGR